MANRRKTSTLPILIVFLVSLFLELLIVEAVDADVNKGTCIEAERKALVEFKNGLLDPSGWLSSWVNGGDCCKWRGVDCNNKTGNVVKLDLRNHDFSYQLSGEISDSILGLKHLSYLDLSGNDFPGIPIPNFLGSLKRLRYLNLSNTIFGGMIPPHLGNLSQLRYLDLHGDHSYEVPWASDLIWLSGLSSLKYLNLGKVNLSKASTTWMDAINRLPSLSELHLPNCELSHFPMSIPFVNLTSLLVIDLSTNHFNSSLPGWLFNITTLEDLDLGDDQLSGQLPDSLGCLKNLRSLKFRYNNFIGPLPGSIQNLSNIEILEVRWNFISGSIPTWIGNLLGMKRLDLSFNQMNGTVPEGIGQLSELTELYLDGNSWEGVVSESHFSNLAKLEVFSLYLSLKKSSLNLKVRPEWIPPFSSLKFIYISNCYVSPSEFPSWLRTQKRLEEITLENVGISDTIPGWLWTPYISSLDLSRNQLYGKLPSSLSFSLYASVDLSFNRLGGRLPLFFNVTNLFLANNLFSGPIPSSIEELSTLSILDVSGNLLNGSIPSSMGTMKRLWIINLSNNYLSGNIPNNWSDLDSLYALDFSKNKLSGGIPSWMCSVFAFTELMLGDNNLSGDVFPSFQNCTWLQSLDLGNNKFSGSIPKWIGERMPLLKQLRLRGNELSGNIPKQLCGLPHLHVLDLALNNLSGSIPQCLGNLSALNSVISFDYSDYPIISQQAAYSEHMDLVVKGQEMEFQSILQLVNLIDLSSNNISGEIPEELTNLTSLGTLNLSRNALIGKIPEKIGAMKGLETLDLSCNQLSGPIPPNMSSITSLSHLNLSHNRLSGPIPTANQFQTFNDPSIYEANLGLCGLPLPTKCSTHDGHDYKYEQEEEEDEDEQGWEMSWFFISMGLGFAVGFWAVCGSLALNKYWRYAYFGFIDESRDRLYVFTAVNMSRLKRKMKRTGVHG